MGAFIAKQPNGLYCRFSTIVDTVTYYDLNEDEYIELCAEEARRQARYDLERNVLPFREVVKRFTPVHTTVADFNLFLKEVGSDALVKEEWYK